ncbi:transcriptional regulator, LysR family [Serratia sp. AS12]|uniref:LysR family transcriptional regulator n=1 Tax=Serratia TaxID=613 RepID=UPI00020E9B36|nr:MULTISPECIES: LysR family transcriptional regulator [Serratia]AEF47352.1 transcriptional regulator, LysR family [Serratia plymuthica AS9]AEF52304.1 transcriptional regulator, LysR family [Serratia sp. AS12]AEG30011.1 transcriptional regulator, LysR family [Serratia sp. AS13]UTN96024.1 LysR family transcriptional regulator [Serratia plymuthica]
MDKFSTMRSFLRVVETGAFIRAAESLGLPKSTVTRQIQALEAELGVKLLHRSSRRLRLTEQGEVYYKGAQDLLIQAERLDNSVSGSDATWRGQLRVEMPGALAYCLLIPRIPDFMNRYPDLQVITSIGNRTSDLIDNQIDCVIRVGALRHDTLISRSLGTLPMAVCAAPQYLEKNGRPTHPSELLKHYLIQVRSPQSGRSFGHQLVKDNGSFAIQGPFQISVNDAFAALCAARAGLGIVTTYAFLVKDALIKGELVSLFDEWEVDKLPVHIAWPENRQLAPRVRLFSDWVRGQFNDMALTDLN